MKVRRTGKAKKESVGMEEVTRLLEELHPGVDFTTGDHLLEDGILDSFDIVTLISELSDRFQIEIPAGKITPEHFSSARSIFELCEKLMEEA